jgi:fatty acid desaturase
LLPHDRRLKFAQSTCTPTIAQNKWAKVLPFALAVQDMFTRTLILPAWIERWVMLSFTTHGVHHAHPEVAHYDLGRVQFSSSHAIRWSDWIRAAKRIPVTQLLYQNSEDTGVSI